MTSFSFGKRYTKTAFPTDRPRRRAAKRRRGRPHTLPYMALCGIYISQRRPFLVYYSCTRGRQPPPCQSSLCFCVRKGHCGPTATQNTLLPPSFSSFSHTEQGLSIPERPCFVFLGAFCTCRRPHFPSLWAFGAPTLIPGASTDALALPPTFVNKNNKPFTVPIFLSDLCHFGAFQSATNVIY